jgi:hypothetical protein
MLVSKGFLEFGVLRSQVGESWNVASVDGTKDILPSSEFTCLVTRKSPAVVWMGDYCQFCHREIETYDMVQPRLGVHDYAGNSNCSHIFHLSCLAPALGVLLDRGAKRKCVDYGVGWKVCCWWGVIGSKVEVGMQRLCRLLLIVQEVRLLHILYC